MSSPRRTMRWFGHPVIVLTMLAFLVADLLSIPADNAHHSTLQRLIIGNPRRSTMHGRPLPGLAIRTEEGLEWVWASDERYEQPEEHGEPLYNTRVFRDLTRRDGFYHLTRQRKRLVIYDAETWPLTPEEADALPGIVVRAIDASEETQTMFARERRLLTAARAIRGEEYVIESRLVGGCIRNVLAAVALGLLLVSFFGGRTWLWQPALSPAGIRRRWRMRRGQCLRCGYDLTGLRTSIECPECGARRV